MVFGAGGHARAVVDVLERLGESVAAVVGEAGGRAWPVEVLTDEAAALDRVVAAGLRAVVAIGASAARLRVLDSILESAETRIESARTPIESSEFRANAALSIGEVAPPVVARTATVARDAELGPGTVVLEHAHVGPATRVGRGVIVNTGAIVEHDCAIDDGAHVAPGACVLGGASVGARTLVGSGARILPQVRVGADVTVGAGTVVTAPVPDGVTVVGVPGRVIRERATRVEESS